MAQVRLENLHKRIGSAEIIPDLSLTVRDGEFFTLVGPSGCGKSTLLHLIAGLDAPTAGRILFDDRDVTALAPRERDVALVFQNYALYPHMTVAENLSFPLRVGPRSGGWNRATMGREVQRVAGLLGLEGLLGRRPRELSGGQRQRVALGRAIIRRPRVFLLDEPLSNLDAQLRAGMRAELRRLHDELGITMIYVTHDQTEAMTLADRLAVLDRGRLQQVGTPQELYDRPDNVFVAGFIGHPSMNTLEARIQDGQVVAGSLRVPLADDLGRRYEGARISLGLRPEDLKIERMRATFMTAGSAGGAVAGTVRYVERTGGQAWVTCEVTMNDRHLAGLTDGVTTLVGVGTPDHHMRSGDRVTFSVAGATPHLFDAETGLRLNGAARGCHACHEAMS